MPFWTAIKSCLHCLHFNHPDPSADTGTCEAGRPERSPFWMPEPGPSMTFQHEGADCAAYVHCKRKPHPLDRAPQVILGFFPGDMITLRTYTAGAKVSTTQAEVVKVHRNHVAVRAFNADYRLRIRATEREHAGSVIGMEDWGLDPDAAIARKGVPMNDMRNAAAILSGKKAGDKVHLLGYPPFDGMRKVAHVVRAGRDELVLRCGHGPKLYMTRRGAMAGLINNDPIWCLDCAHAEQTATAD